MIPDAQVGEIDRDNLIECVLDVICKAEHKRTLQTKCREPESPAQHTVVRLMAALPRLRLPQQTR